MASTSDIEAVRRGTDEPEDATTYEDDLLSQYVDAHGVAGAIALVWREKSASYAGLVDVTEAGASHKFSSLASNAAAQAKAWQDQADAVETVVSDRPRVKKIVRS